MSNVSRFASLILLLLLASTPCHASNFFEPCSAALAKPSFRALAKYLGTKSMPDATISGFESSMCLRLNNHEFIVLPRSIGIDYCDFRDGSSCGPYDNQDGRHFEKNEIFQEFSEASGKHFVLLRDVNLEHGIYTELYDLLFLVDPSGEKGHLPFRIVSLTGASMNNDSGSFTDNPCGEPDPSGNFKSPASVGAVGAPQISSNEGHAVISFSMKEMDCHTRKSTVRTIRFQNVGNRFVETR